jgi:hypothetical protein
MRIHYKKFKTREGKIKIYIKGSLPKPETEICFFEV